MALIIPPTSVNAVTGSMLVTAEHLDTFGKQLIACCLEKKELFDLARYSVDYDCNTNDYTGNDFLDPVDGLVFSAMFEFSKCWQEGNPWPGNRTEWAQAVVRHFGFFFSQHPEFPQLFRQEAMTRIITGRRAAPGDYDHVCDGLIDYIKAVRHHRFLLSSSGLTPAEREKRQEELRLSVRVPGMQVAVTRVKDLRAQIYAAQATSHPFYTGVKSFDYLYGRRARKGDAWLVFALPGGGKTNLACQTMSYSAAEGRHVLYVTTEVDRQTLLLRGCAAKEGTSYSSLKTLVGSGATGPSNHPQARLFDSWCDQVDPYLSIMDYREISGTDYREKYSRMLDAFYKAHGQSPDLVIWDWIGGALDSGYKDAWQKREAYGGVAMMMVRSADELNNQTIVLAQADKSTKNKTNLHESDTQDNHALCDGMEGVMGITGIQESGDMTTSDRAVYKDQQLLVVCKCRDEEARSISVVRRFDMARFESTG